MSTANVPPSQPVDGQVLGRLVLPRKEVSVTVELGVVHTGVAVLEFNRDTSTIQARSHLHCFCHQVCASFPTIIA